MLGRDSQGQVFGGYIAWNMKLKNDLWKLFQNNPAGQYDLIKSRETPGDLQKHMTNISENVAHQ